MVRLGATFDSSFWINAHRAGLLVYVLDRYELRYAPHVAAELNAGYPSGREFWIRVRAGELIQSSPSRLHLTDFGLGERAAISLAIEQPDWILLMDDLRPFREAASRGLSIVCTPVLVVALFREGAIDANEAIHALARLAALQTVSPHLIATTLAQLGASLEGQGG